MHRLRCFGRLAVESDEGERVQLRSRKHLALLLYLAAHRGRRHERGRLARLFWDTEIDLARHSLSQALYDLRQHVPDLELDRTNREVGLGPDGLLYEGEAFEDSVRHDRLGRAVDLYGGPFAPDLEAVGSPDFERWLERERTRYRSLAEKALLRRVSECAETGNWGEMCVAGNRLVDMNPLNEEAHRAVIRGLWLRGDRQAALGHFQEYESTLERELPGGIDDDTWALVEKIRSSTRPGGRRTVHERPRPEMVGREAEFRTLKQALADAVAGESRFILVRGEAGIGKTRLLEEFEEVADLEDVRLLKSRCYAAESDVPYGPIIEGLEEVARDVAEQATGDGEEFVQLGHLFPEVFGKPEASHEGYVDQRSFRRRLAAELRRLFVGTAKVQPVVWLIENLHWADQSSVWLLDFLARRVDQGRCLLIATVRDVISAEEDNLSTTDWKRLNLTPLTDNQIRQIISGTSSRPHGEVSDSIIRRAGGNPYFALELAKFSQERSEGDGRESRDIDRYDVPSQISEVLDSHISSLSPQAVNILRILAVADSPVVPNLILAITNASTSELMQASEDLYRRQLIQDDGEKLFLNHELIGQFIYQSTDELSKTALHLEIADWLDAHRREIDPGTLAHHYYKANVRQQAFRRAIEAASKALESYAIDESIHLAEIALECGESAHDRRQARTLLADAQYRGGRFTSARRTLRQLQVQTDDSQTIGGKSIQLLRAEIAIELARWGEAKEAIRRLDEDDDHTSPENLVWARHLLLKASIREGDYELATELREEIESIASEGASIEFRTLVWMSRAAYWAFFGHIGEASSYVDFLDAHTGDLPKHLIYPARHLGTLVGLRLGKPDIARSQAQLVYSEAARRQDVVNIATSLNNLLSVNIEIGDWNAAESTLENIETAVTEEVDSPNYRLLLGINRGDYLFYTEDFKKGQEHYENLIGNIPSDGLGYVRPELLAGYGLILAARGELKEAWQAWRLVDDQQGQGELLKSGIQDRYKIYWLDAFVRWREGEEGVSERLKEIANQEEKMDVPGAARIRWIGRLLAEAGDGKRRLASASDLLMNMESDELEGLGENHLRWFGYFSRRWLRRAVAER